VDTGRGLICLGTPASAGGQNACTTETSPGRCPCSPSPRWRRWASATRADETAGAEAHHIKLEPSGSAANEAELRCMLRMLWREDTLRCLGPVRTRIRPTSTWHGARWLPRHGAWRCGQPRGASPGSTGRGLKLGRRRLNLGQPGGSRSTSTWVSRYRSAARCSSWVSSLPSSSPGPAQPLVRRVSMARSF
jgi:hypothetical protein